MKSLAEILANADELPNGGWVVRRGQQVCDGSRLPY